MTQHTYLGVNFEITPVSGMYCVLLGDVPVTGTHSQSPGEAAMRFMVMLESMLERESLPMQKGDVLEVGDKRYLIDSLSVQRYIEGTTMQEIAEGEPATVECLQLREGLGDGETNFRGPSSAYVVATTPIVSLSGGPFATRPRVARYEMVDVEEIEFWAWQDTPRAQGGFKYKRDVNVWREVDDESSN